MKPDVKGFFDPNTFTISYVVSDPATKKAAIIDSVMDYAPHAGRLTHDSADALIDHVNAQGLDVEWLLETHVHADHVSAAPYLKDKVGGTLAIGAHITDVQGVFGTCPSSGFFGLRGPFCNGGSGSVSV